MGFINKIFGINFSNIKTEDVEVEEDKRPKYITYISYILMEDGTVLIKTDWENQSNGMAHIYANLLYKIGEGEMHNATLETLMQYAMDNVKGQEFIVAIMEELKKICSADKDSPLIIPSKALAINFPTIKDIRE